MDESILLESGERVIVAVPQGDACVFNKTRLEFVRPKWTDDAAAMQCLYCKQKFTQLRRKHHCRSCGRLFCSKCCNDKTQLTHLGISDVERTCLICKPILSLMTQAFSNDIKMKTAAAAGFHQLIQSMKHMQEVVELGGLHTLIWLCGANSASSMYKPLISALHILATQVSLQKYLLKAGVVQALSSMMQNLNPSDQLTTDCISTLRILSNRPETVQQVVIDGGLSSLLCIMPRVDELTGLLTLQTIMKMSGVPHSHTQIMSNIPAVKYLTTMVANSQDLQVSTLIFSIFGEISAGELLEHKLLLSKEEAESEYISRCLINGGSGNKILFSNIACLVANLAGVPETQIYLTGIVTRLGGLLNDATTPYYSHVIRAMANFSQFSQHSVNLMQWISVVISGMQLVTDPQTHNQSLRLLSNLLTHSPPEVSDLIFRNDGRLYLTKLIQTPRIAASINGILKEISSNVSRP